MDGCSEIPVALYSLWNPVAGFKVLFSIHSWDRLVAYFYMESTRIEDLHSELFYGPCCDFWVQLHSILSKYRYLSRLFFRPPFHPKVGIWGRSFPSSCRARHPMLDECTADGEKNNSGTGMVGLPPAQRA
jgi:hypothetical protein